MGQRGRPSKIPSEQLSVVLELASAKPLVTLGKLVVLYQERTGTLVHATTLRKALKEVSVVRIKPARRALPAEPGQAVVRRYGYGERHGGQFSRLGCGHGRGGADEREVSDGRAPYDDSAYAGQWAASVKAEHGITVEVIRHPANRNVGRWVAQGRQDLFNDGTYYAGFTVLPKRWVVERTHAWNERARRLIMHHDRLVSVSEAC